MMPSLKVIVLMGGPSEEHAISLKSGEGITEALARRQWRVEPVVIPKAITIEQACAFVRQALQRLTPEVVFIALHGTCGEDGTIQQVCEDAHVPYTGSDPAASRLGMDKVASRRRFIAAGLAVPRWQLIASLQTRVLPAGWAYPVVVKPVSQGSSIGVSLVLGPAGWTSALREAGRYGWPVLLEEFVEGDEVTVGVLGDEPLPVVGIRPTHAFFDFSAKYTLGATEYLVPAPLSPPVAAAVQAAGLTAHRALGCRHLSRTDLILRRDGTPVVLEVNTVPGFTPTSLVPKAAACAHLSYDELCERLALMTWNAAPHLAKA